MVDGFQSLDERDFTVLKDAIAWITALIAGADGKIDAKETEWAKKLTHIRSYAPSTELNAFYEEVGKDFGDKLDALIEQLPGSVEESTGILSRKLEQVNDVLPCLHNSLAYELYDSYMTFAKHVAKVSGGFLGMMSISKEEAALMTLPMITPIALDEEE